MPYLAICFALCCCSETQEVADDTRPIADPVAADTLRATLPATVYAWVNNLNIRAAPDASARVVAKVGPADALATTGNRSDRAVPYVLRGGLYVEPWLEVTTPAGVTGWVFGGAVKESGERIGNQPLSETRFNYPYLGQFDLTRWEKEKDVSGRSVGDVTYVRDVTYRGDGQRMHITETESEYGYGIDHRLYNLKGDLLKERRVSYDNSEGRLSETVVDHMAANAVRHYREQRVPVSYQQLNAAPRIVRAEWRKE